MKQQWIVRRRSVKIDHNHTMKPPPLPKFKIFMFESPASKDLLEGRCEGRALSEALILANIPNQYFRIADKETLLKHLGRVRLEIKESIISGVSTGEPAIICWLHLSCHGNELGISLTSGEFINWTELRGVLVKYFRWSQEITPLLVLSLSSCGGAHAAPAMLSGNPPYGCSMLVGPNREIGWADSLTAFIVLFHLTLVKQRPASLVRPAMNQAAGLDDGTFEIHILQTRPVTTGALARPLGRAR